MVQPFLSPRTAGASCPGLYRTPAKRAVPHGRQCHSPDRSRQEPFPVGQRAEKIGRKVRFAYNPFVCFGDNEEDARKRAQDLVRTDGDDADTRKMLNRIGPSMKSGCVGHPDQVRAQVERFHDMGIELLLFKFVPNVEETRSIAKELIAPWRAKHGEAKMQAAE